MKKNYKTLMAVLFLVCAGTLKGARVLESSTVGVPTAVGVNPVDRNRVLRAVVDRELRVAVMAKNVGRVTGLLTHYRALINLKGRDLMFGRTVLHNAVMCWNEDKDSDMTILRNLLFVDLCDWFDRRGSAIDLQDAGRQTPLDWAACRPGGTKHPIYQLLLDYKTLLEG